MIRVLTPDFPRFLSGNLLNLVQYYLPSRAALLVSRIVGNNTTDAHPNNDRTHHQNPNHHHGHPHRDRRALLERTPLARLRFEEQLMERRRLNVSNFGSAWLKPPGVPKSLFQMREERREAEEHAEAMRREEQLAAIAEAEGEGVMGEGVLDEPMGEEGEEEEEVQDLDDDIPEAEGFGFDGEDDSEDEEETVEEEEEDTEEDEDGSVTGTGHAGVVQVSPAERRDMREEVRGMRAAEDRVREVMALGQEGDGLADDDVDNDLIDAEDREEMLEEDDLVHVFDHDAPGDAHPSDLSMDMDMDADLDGDVPEADDGYEHTDSDAELSEDGTRDISFAGTGHGPQASRFQRSLLRSSIRSSHRGSLAQTEFDISGLLSGDGSSYMEGSPQMRRRGG
ncbi:hypothetical protein VP1G_06003 [Cytospora mali]|uniref:Replicase polyprotein 1a n=1 Tax=Cytospora mali TaxID=578113 RepID=A0A194V429_CYTMA|nr:hypothetical protein VP1G_06003 [Valsa mali var. pyri (nom. inval.)]